MARRGLKICCFALVVFLVILTIIIVTLSLTVFKPKDPQITVHPIGLKNIQFNVTAPDVTFSTLMTIKNPNYCSFEYESTAGYVIYNGSTVGEFPIMHHKIPARARVNTTTSTDLIIDKLISCPSFWEDFASGWLNFTSTVTLPGKARMVKIFKFHATVYSTCYIKFHFQSKDVDSKCNTKIKF